MPVAAAALRPRCEGALDRRAHAAQNAAVRVATFNIKHAEVAGLDAVAEALLAVDADLIGLQEVDCGTRRSGGVDQARALGERLDMAWAFARAIDFDGGPYGNALLARWSLTGMRPLAARAVALPGGTGPGEEGRVLLCARAGGLRVFVTHLDLPERARRAQAEAVAAAISFPGAALLLCDANEGVAGPAAQHLLRLPLRDAWREAKAPERPTAPGDRPQERIDLVLLGEGLGPARAARAVDTGASDHPVVVVDL